MNKHVKRIVVFISLILIAAGLGILINMITREADKQDTSQQASVKSDIPSIEIDSNGMKKPIDTWDTFLQDSENGIATSIQLNYEYPGQIPRGGGTYGAATKHITLEYDGEYYLCFGKKYKYLQELTGRTPNAAKNTTYVILSDEQYSFTDISNSIYSSNSNDQIPYMLLFLQ